MGDQKRRDQKQINDYFLPSKSGELKICKNAPDYVNLQCEFQKMLLLLLEKKRRLTQHRVGVTLPNLSKMTFPLVELLPPPKRALTAVTYATGQLLKLFYPFLTSAGVSRAAAQISLPGPRLLNQ